MSKKEKNMHLAVGKQRVCITLTEVYSDSNAFGQQFRCQGNNLK